MLLHVEVKPSPPTLIKIYEAIHHKLIHMSLEFVCLRRVAIYRRLNATFPNPVAATGDISYTQYVYSVAECYCRESAQSDLRDTLTADKSM